jgi:hypothetical protein
MPHGRRSVRRIDVNGATWYRSPTTPFRSYLRIPFEELLPKFELIANPLWTWIERAAKAIAEVV